MLRSVRFFNVIPLGAHRAIPQGVLGIGCALGVALGALEAGSIPVLLVAAVIAVVSANRLLEAAEIVGTPIKLGHTSSVLLLAAIACVSGPALGQEAASAAQARDDMEQASDEATADARAFTERVLELARSHRDVESLAVSTLARINEGMSQAGAMLNTEGFNPQELMGPDHTGPVIYVLVSLGMPDEALRRYVREAHQIGGVVMVRGFIGNSFSQTQARIAGLFDEETLGGISIDPRPFQAFGVDRVPAIIYAQSQVEPCGGLDCVPVAPEHDIVRGNISIAAALQFMGR